MERSGSGGFHGYRRIPQTNSGSKLPEMNSSNSSNNAPSDDNECVVREQDRFMPIANVIRIMRKILPPHAKISDDAKETIQECVSEYISFVTGEANERCQREQRKTITAEDVLWAMSKLGFDDYIEPLTLYLHRYREFDGGDRGASAASPSSVSPLVRSASDAQLLMMRRAAAVDHQHHHLPGILSGGFANFPPPPPAFQVPHMQHGGLYGAIGGGFLKDPAGSSGPSSDGGPGNTEPYGQRKE